MKRHIILATSLAAAAFAGSPNISTITPGAGQRGQEVEVVLAGSRLADARTLLFDEPGVTVLGVSEAEAGKFKAKLKIAPDARIGEYVYRAITNSGIADTRLFYVTPYPVQKEAEEVKDAPYKVQPAPLGVTIYGSTPGEDQDHFEITMKKGQRLTAEVVAIRLSTQQQYDAFLSITKADGVTTLAEMDDGPFTRQDPALSVIAPEDGKYRVMIKEATNSGQGPCNYLLHIGSHPRPVVAYPGGGLAGTEVKFNMLGDAGGPFEQAVKLPATPEARFEVLAQKDGLTAPQPNYVRVSPFGNVLEVEPNDDAKTATKAPGPLPLAFNGIIEKKDDVDYFKFTAKKDETFRFAVHARSLRSPIDPVLVVANAQGGTLASNDDNGFPDSYIPSWKVPADGEYCLYIHDQLKRGGPLFTYRVEVTSIKAELAAYLPEMVNNSSQERRAIPVPKGNRYGTLVRVRRADAGGDIILEPKDLPPGVSISADKIDKSVDTVPVVFDAAADAAAAQKSFQLLPKLSDAAAMANVVSKVEHRVEVTENGNQRAYYGVTEGSLPIAVTDEVPVTIELHQPKVPILHNGQFNFKVTATRKAGPDGKPLFNGAINALQVLWGPPGIGTPGTVNIAEGKSEGVLAISCNGNAPVAKWKTCVVGTVDTGKGPTWISTKLVELETAPTFITGALKRTYIDQASDGSMSMSIEHKAPFEGKAKLTLLGLPQGVTADEREITKDDKEVKFTLKAAPDAQAGQHKTIICQFTLVKDGEPMLNTVASGGILRVDKNATPAKVAEAKK